MKKLYKKAAEWAVVNDAIIVNRSNKDVIDIYLNIGPIRFGIFKLRKQGKN